MRGWKLRLLALLLSLNLLSVDLNGQTPIRYSIVIDEILPDPAPAVGLPNAEFVELKNVSGGPINLKQWKLSDGSSTATINIDYYLQADSFVIICSAPVAALFASFGSTIGVNNFPSLNNDADVITVYSSDGSCIHAVAYQLNWFNNAVKSEGGWTLEMVDTRNPCEGENNWKASTDIRGGTPGRINSSDRRNPDVQTPTFTRAYVLDSITVMAVFDEPLDSNEAANSQHYLFDDASIIILRSTAKPSLFKEVELKISRPLEAGKLYQLSITGIKDCSNNFISANNKKPVGLSTLADSLDLVINEILFNPVSDGVDYVELYNRSQKIIDISRLYISNRNANGVINAPQRMSEAPLFFFPGDYLALSESSMNIRQHFFSRNVDWLLNVSSLPSFPDDRGVVLILNEQGKIIDELRYDQDWHFALLQNKEGVSLERIDPGAGTQSRDNWTSAASSVGFGTPALQNSQYKNAAAQAGSISIDPSVFSPDNDGVDDICFIRYEMTEPNFVANILVFDANGREVRRLYNNATLTQNGTLRWDGLGENYKPLPIGIYIIYTEIFNLQGKRKKFKNVVTLARRI